MSQRYIGATQVDYRGRLYVLGRTLDAYAIWDAGLGGQPLRRFGLTSEGWADAWYAFQQLEGGGPVFATPGGEWFRSPTATWTKGRPMTLGPMRVGQILDGAFKLYRMRFFTLLAVVALILLPIQTALLALTLATLEPVLLPGVPGAPTAVLQQPSPWVGVGAIAVQILFVNPFLTASVVKVAADSALGGRPTVGSTYRSAISKVHSILWVTILIFLAGIAFFVPAGLAVYGAATTGQQDLALVALLLALAAVVPAVFVYLRLAFAPAVVMVEDLRGTKALRRSWQLVRGLTWKVLGTNLLAGLIVAALALVLGVILAVILLAGLRGDVMAGVVGPGYYAFQEAFNAVIGILTTPFLTLVVVLLYFDARIRKEAFDLALMAQQIGSAPPAGA